MLTDVFTFSVSSFSHGPAFFAFSVDLSHFSVFFTFGVFFTFSAGLFFTFSGVFTFSGATHARVDAADVMTLTRFV